MPNNVGLNLATKAGEGAADVMQWGNLDKSTNQIYQEQKQREQRGYNEYLAGEKIIQGELGKGWSADVPELASLYADRKKTSQQLFFDEKIKNNPVLLAQKQNELKIKDAAFMQAALASQQRKEREKLINNRKASHVDEFSDEGLKQHTLDMSIPTSQLFKEGRGDITAYLDNSPQTDFQKISKEAMGEKQTLPLGQEKVTSDQWEIEAPQMSRRNTPIQYYESVKKSLSPGKSAKDARKTYTAMQPSDINKIVENFVQIPEDVLKNQWGIKKEDLLDKLDTDDKVQKFAALDAMNYAANFKPEVLPSKFRENKEYVYNLKRGDSFEDFLAKNKITSAQAMERARLYWQRQQDKENASVGGVDAYINDAKSGKVDPTNGFAIMNFKPSTTAEYKKEIVVPVDIVNAKLKEKGQPFKSKKVSVTPTILQNTTSGDYWAVYPKVNEKTGEISKNYEWNNGEHKIPETQVKATITKTELPSGFKIKQVVGDKGKADYSHIKETNKGQLGYKDGKWYYTQTGKEYK